MARRAPSAATDDSQKENSSTNARVKHEKGKPERVGNLRGTRVEEEHEEEETHGSPANDGEGGQDDGEEEDAYGEENEDQDEGSSRGRKRARANSMGDSHSSPHGKGKGKAEPRTLPRDVDGYIPGSIVRVRLENFVTYDFVEFNPGPYLNMILGPNGTGKSSIACAICIGLNFPPSTLGRATDVSSFVKIGQTTGSIEIELKGPSKKNVTIRRTLKAATKSSQFFINGKVATSKEVSATIAQLNVQVTNLCSFLPQDKVAEFARMSPQELLKETQHAAGNSNLSSWHQLLIEKGKELKKMNEELGADREQLHTAEERNATLEREVRAYEERRKIELEIEFLDLLLPFRQYNDAKSAYVKAKDAKNELGVKVRKLQQKNSPITKLKEELDEKHREIDQQREAKKSATRTRYAAMKKLWQQNDALEKDADEYKTTLDNLKRKEKDRQKQIERAERELATSRDEFENPPEIEDTGVIEAEKAQIIQETRQAKARYDDIQDEQRQSIQQEATLKQRIENIQREIHQLNNVDVQKLTHLERWDKDCADTVRWLRQNKDKFKMDVFEPPLLSVNVKDKRYAAAVEACFSNNDMKCFAMQCEEDYSLFNRLVVDTGEALGHKARLNTWFRRNITPTQAPVSREELQTLGFDGYALDYLQYPAGMEVYLQNALNLHRTPLAVLNPQRVHPVNAMESLSRSGSIRYIVGNIMNTVNRSRYGQRLAQNQTREFGQARNFATATVDQAAKQHAEQRLHEAQTELAMQQPRMKELAEEESRSRERHNELKAQMDAIKARFTAVVDARRKLDRLKHKIASNEALLQRLRNEPPVAEERVRLKAKILDNGQKRMKGVVRYQALLRQAIDDQFEATKSGLEYLQVGAKKLALENIVKTRQEELKRTMDEFREAELQYRNAKSESKSKLVISKSKLDAAQPEVRDRFRALEEAGEIASDPRSVNEILGELETKKAELDLNLHTNAGVVETYKKRQAEIATLSQKIENQEQRSQRMETTIKRTRDLWEPELTRLVESIGKNFSSAFDRIGCAGQINIAQHEDYDKWAIEILVKFRDEEKLQLLTAERQSGGERSLTTILYLMSLTEHARAPFSLVDEINQGMDSRAERAVHDSLVEVTCKPDSGQYFLITPKLLPDLTYHERMKVLCVANGEWLPEDHMTGNLMNMIEAYVQARA